MDKPKFDSTEEVVVSEMKKGDLLLSKAGMTVRVEDIPDENNLIPLKILVSGNVIKVESNLRLYKWTQEKATDYSKLVKTGILEPIPVEEFEETMTSDLPTPQTGVDATSMSEVINDQPVTQTQESTMSEEVNKVEETEEAVTDSSPTEETTPVEETTPEGDESAPETTEVPEETASAKKVKRSGPTVASVLDEIMSEPHTVDEVVALALPKLPDITESKLRSRVKFHYKVRVKQGKKVFLNLPEA